MLDVFEALGEDAPLERLGRAWPRRAGLSEARASRDRLAGRSGAAAEPPHSGAPGQGRLLGHRDQARPGDGDRRLSRLHAQDAAPTRRILPARARCSPTGRRSIRNSPPTTRTRCGGARRSPAQTRDFEYPAPARHGRGAVRALHEVRKPRAAGAGHAHLCAGGHARGSARLSGAAAAGERRQHLLRQSPGRRRSADRGDHRRSGGARRGHGQPQAQPAHRQAGERFSRPQEFGGPSVERSRQVGAAARRHASERWRSRRRAHPDRRRQGARSAPTHAGDRSVRPPPRGRARWPTCTDDDVKAALDLADRAQHGVGRAGRRRTRRDSRTRGRSVRAEPRAPDGAGVREGGQARCPTRWAKLREAVDFLRYYAGSARARFRGADAAARADAASRTSCRCTAAACSPASRRGISRWRFSPARWRARWPPAMPCWPSPPNRRR